MKRKFLQRLIVIGFILIFQMPFLSSADETISLDILNAAQEGIKIFLQDTQSSEQFGFSARDEVDSATLGKGFEVFTVPPDSLLKGEASKDLSSLAISTNLWQFVIVAGGKAKVLLTVGFMDRGWAPVSMGSAGLAKELGKVLETWPESAGYQYKLIRIYQAKSDFLEISLGGKAIGVIPLISARVSMGIGKQGFDPQDLYNSEGVTMRMRAVVRKNLEMGN
jgi:hypothetical protein